MADTTTGLPHFDTFDELLEQLGDIPPSRIRMRPAPGTATEKDAIVAAERYDRFCELIDGTLVEKPMGFYEGRLGSVLNYFIEDFLTDNDLGIVIGEGGLMRVEPKQVRIPDVAFYSWDQFPGRKLPRGSILDYVPDLAVEILSPSNTKKEMQRKRKEYFLGGCKLVWEVDPKRKSVRVFTAPDESKRVSRKGTLDGGDVLPGFKLSIAQWFKRAGERE